VAVKRGMGRPEAAARILLVLLLARFLTTAFPRQSFLCPFLLARLQVVGVSLDLLDDIFLLHFALETAQGALQRFALL
jgi:hypothetical protein